jgi:hypothetical protein
MKTFLKYFLITIPFILALFFAAFHFHHSAPQATPEPSVTLSPVENNRQQLDTGSISRVGPASLYPDPKLTPGKADTVNAADLKRLYNGLTYSKAHRNVPAAEHTQVYDEYNVSSSKRNIKNGEVDHDDPVCNGGSNDISNLWYQPITNMWNGKNYGFKQKDDLETWICVQVKAGKLDPKEAYQRITNDWVKFYLDAKPPHQTFGSVVE